MAVRARSREERERQSIRGDRGKNTVVLTEAPPANLPDVSGSSQSAPPAWASFDPAQMTGSGEEQLAQITEALREADALGDQLQTAVVRRKADLLTAARAKELWSLAGFATFHEWGGHVLDVAPNYVYELLEDAQRISTIEAMGAHYAGLLTRASSRKTVAELVETHGMDRAREMVDAAYAETVRLGKKRPTETMIRDAAKQILEAAIPHQLTQLTAAGVHSEISESENPSADEGSVHVAEIVTVPVSPQLKGLGKSVEWVENIYKSIAPAAVKTAAEADPEEALRKLDLLSGEVVKVTRRIESARKDVVRRIQEQAKQESEVVDAETVDEPTQEEPVSA